MPPTMPSTTTPLTISDVGLRLKLPYAAVRNLCFVGELTATKRGRYFEISADSVDRYERKLTSSSHQTAEARR
jgi:hypothetical protein